MHSCLLTGGKPLAEVGIDGGVLFESRFGGSDSGLVRFLHQRGNSFQHLFKDKSTVIGKSQRRKSAKENRGHITAKHLVQFSLDGRIHCENLFGCHVLLGLLRQFCDGIACRDEAPGNADVGRVDFDDAQQCAVSVFHVIAFDAAINNQFHDGCSFHASAVNALVVGLNVPLVLTPV